MIKNKSISRASPLFVVLWTLGFFFGTYNLVKIIIDGRNTNLGADRVDIVSLSTSIDPIIKIPKNVRLPFHVAVTAGSDTYERWQCRIMYYWYKRVKDMPGSEMGGFTRVLHSGSPDNLMHEIPTFVVDPLPPGQDQGYVVLNRPWAFVQWLEKAKIEEEYILMAEPDHIFIKPLPNLARGENAAAFVFYYIKPFENEKIIRKFYPSEKGPLTNIQQIGNSPVIIKKSLLKKISPTWMNVSIAMKNDPEADKSFDWVLEMYGYAVASALHGVKHILRKDFMLQPPWDVKTGKKFMIHYCFPLDYNSKGVLTFRKSGWWQFYKRAYMEIPPPKNHSLPPPGSPESVVTLIKMMNEATANLPGWKAAKKEFKWGYTP